MRIPGFTAEASIYKSTGFYTMATSSVGIQVELVETAQASINYSQFRTGPASSWSPISCPPGLVPILVKKQVRECLEEGVLGCHIDRWEPMDPSNLAIGRWIWTCTEGCVQWGLPKELESWECRLPTLQAL